MSLGRPADSYGYRPGRSALDAVAACRQRCWKRDWVIDLDIQAFFDSLDHGLVLKAVAKHTDLRWVQLYCNGSCKRRCRCRTAPGADVIAEPRKGPRSHLCWRT